MSDDLELYFVGRDWLEAVRPPRGWAEGFATLEEAEADRDKFEAHLAQFKDMEPVHIFKLTTVPKDRPND